MAEEKKILYKIVVDGETAKATIFNLTGGVKKLNIAVEDLDEVLGDMNGEMSKTTSGIGRQMASLKKQRSQVQINSKEYQNLTKSMRFYQSQMDMSTGATGSASSAAMELGRVLSDAPYGIRGVANNLSQFASQMAFAAKSTGSLKLAVKDLFKALTGPLGILLAIQAVIAIFEKMSMAKQKAKEDSEDLNKALKKEIQTLEGYVNVLNHSNSSLEERNGAILSLISSDKKYIKSILEGNETLSEQEQAVRALLMAEKDKLSITERRQRAEELNNTILKGEVRTIKEVQRDIDKLNKRYEEAATNASTSASAVSGYYETLLLGEKNVIKALKERKEIFDSLVDDVEVPIATRRDSEAFLKEAISDLEKIRAKTAATSKEYKAQTTSIDVLKKQLEELTGVKKKGGSNNKLSIFDTPEELELKVKDTLNARQKLAQKTEMINLKTEEKSRLAETQNEEDKTFIKEEYALRRLKITEKYEKKAINAKADADIKSAQDSYNTYIKKINKEVVAFEDKLKKDGKALTKAEKKMLTDAKKVASDKKESAKTELTDAIILIEAEYGKLFPFWKKMAAARRTAIGQDKPIGEAEEFTLQDGLKKYMEVQSSMTSFLGGEYDRQLTIEQNKTNALNNELNQRLLNENLSKDERERIQLQIGQNDEKLRKKQEAIEKKRFKLNKAANIAGAAINTYLAASQIMADPSFVGRPVARFAAMATAITTGLLNVAKIARQKFQSSAGSGGSIGPAAGGNGEGESREFNFNLAGSTQTNQLTQSIAGQLSQPIQAYVVSSEITSQQQLDLNIANTATIG